jgi:cytochrome c-type biogenesis protein
MTELIVPAFIAGLLTFLAPCTLPLVPGYLAFISGVSVRDLRDGAESNRVRALILKNGLSYILGFSLVFIAFGSLFGFVGSALVAYRGVLARVGGIMIIFFGLYLIHVFDWSIFSFLNREKRFDFANKLTPGRPSSSFIFGATFALGWSPCIGPILGSILLLASTRGGVWQGTLLLTVFSLGLAVPFMLIALAVGRATEYIRRISVYLKILSFVGGLFILALGILLVTDSFGIWVAWAYRAFSFINLEGLYDYL